MSTHELLISMMVKRLMDNPRLIVTVQPGIYRGESAGRITIEDMKYHRQVFETIVIDSININKDYIPATRVIDFSMKISKMLQIPYTPDYPAAMSIRRGVNDWCLFNMRTVADNYHELYLITLPRSCVASLINKDKQQLIQEHTVRRNIRQVL